MSLFRIVNTFRHSPGCRFAQGVLQLLLLHTHTLQETKSQLTMTLKKLKEAREEGEQIRADLKTMIIQYQVSPTSDVCMYTGNTGSR